MTNARTILVVEDEIIILVDLADQLRSVGYSVIECLEAAQAIAILATGLPIDLVFSDLQMPGAFDGHDLAHWVSRHRPEVRVVLTSGNPHVLSRAAGDLGCATVTKPYVHRELMDLFSASFAITPGVSQGRPRSS